MKFMFFIDSRFSIMATLPHSNHFLLKGFICVLSKISQHADSNGMNPLDRKSVV